MVFDDEQGQASENQLKSYTSNECARFSYFKISDHLDMSHLEDKSKRKA
jgi:hypothetical protein